MEKHVAQGKVKTKHLDENSGQNILIAALQPDPV